MPEGGWYADQALTRAEALHSFTLAAAYAARQEERLGSLEPGKLADLVNGLEQTHRMGVRYPIPTYMKYEPEVGFTVPLADIFKKEELNKLFQR